MTGILQLVRGASARVSRFVRGAAAWFQRPDKLAFLLLGVMAAASLALAFVGATRALELAKDYAVGALAGLAILCVVACSRMMGRPSLLALHLGFALVLGGWVVNEVAGVPDRFVELSDPELINLYGPEVARQQGWTCVAQLDQGLNFVLDKFETSYYPGTDSESQYTSHGRIPYQASDGSVHYEKVDISVNHPLVRKGWWVYQSGCGMQKGIQPETYEEVMVVNPHTKKPFFVTVLHCVKDVGLPLVAFGGVLLLLGSLRLIVFKRRHSSGESQPTVGNGLMSQLADMWQGQQTPGWFVFTIRALYALLFLIVSVALVRHGFSKVHSPMQSTCEYLVCAAALIPVLMFACAKVDGRGPLLVDPALLVFAFLPVVLFMNGGMSSLKLALLDSFSLSRACVYVLSYVILFAWARRKEGSDRRGIVPLLLTLGLLMGLMHVGLSSEHQRVQCLYDLPLCFTAAVFYFPSWRNGLMRAFYALVSLGLVAMLAHYGYSTGNFPLQNMRECLMCMVVLAPFITFAGARVNGRESLLAGAVLVALMAPMMLYLDGRMAHAVPTERLYYVPHVCAGILGYVLAVRTAAVSGRRPLGIWFTLVTLALLLGLMHVGFVQEMDILPPLNDHMSYHHLLCLYDALVCLAVLMVYFPSIRKAAVRILCVLVFLGVVAMLVHRGYKAGHAPMQNMYEFLICTAALLPVLTLNSALWDRQKTLMVDLVLLALVLLPVAFFMDGNVKRLMPALQSPLFVPHVGAYVIGYILLVRAALGAGRRLVGLGFFLITLGLMLGALWGKICWGHWWQFDPKEMWSLATWLFYAAYFHLRARLPKWADRIFLVVGALLAILTLTWASLSRTFSGQHSYA